MTPAPPRLLPPEGAEPGSAWLVCGRKWNRTDSWQWTGAYWRWPHANREWPAELAAASGWTLDDPHGLAAAVRLLEAAGMTAFAIHFVGRGFTVWCSAPHRDAVSASHLTSALAAAQAALAEWKALSPKIPVVVNSEVPPGEVQVRVEDKIVGRIVGLETQAKTG
jgi:hypothetical protein